MYFRCTDPRTHRGSPLMCKCNSIISNALHWQPDCAVMLRLRNSWPEFSEFLALCLLFLYLNRFYPPHDAESHPFRYFFHSCAGLQKQIQPKAKVVGRLVLAESATDRPRVLVARRRVRSPARSSYTKVHLSSLNSMRSWYSAWRTEFITMHIIINILYTLLFL